MVFFIATNIKLFLCTCAVTLLVSFVTSFFYYQWHPVVTSPVVVYKRPPVDVRHFLPVNVHRMFTYANVCIEYTAAPVRRSIHLKNGDRNFNETMQIVVYNAAENRNETLSVDGSPNSVWNDWDITFKMEARPVNYTPSNEVAFFVAPTCAGNLHHFWEDEFRPLFSVVRASERLHEGLSNRILYRFPWDLDEDERDCYDIRVYKDLLTTLRFQDSNDVFYKLRQNTCFNYGVFGLTDISSKPREAVDYVTEYYGVSRDSCVGETVTIVQRTYRRLLNAQELLKVAQSVGFTNVQIVSFHNLTMKEQVQTAACTSIMVGIQGAGLEWSIFMKPGSALIEIAWPERFWGFYFKKYVAPYGILHREINTRLLRVNWMSYQLKVRGGATVATEERRLLLSRRPKSPAMDNVWKWADAMVDAPYFKAALNSVQFMRKAPNVPLPGAA